MGELFIVLKFTDGDERFLYFDFPSQAAHWADIYKSKVAYDMYCYDSEEDYYLEREDLYGC